VRDITLPENPAFSPAIFGEGIEIKLRFVTGYKSAQTLAGWDERTAARGG